MQHDTLNLPCYNITQYSVEVDEKIITSETKLVRHKHTNQLIATLSLPLRNIIYGFVTCKGDLLNKEQIKMIGWPHKSVSNSSVLVAISEIRALIGDDKIITVTGEGYIYP